MALRAVRRRLECEWIGNWGGVERVGLAKTSALSDGYREIVVLLWFYARGRCLGCGWFYGAGGLTRQLTWDQKRENDYLPFRWPVYRE